MRYQVKFWLLDVARIAAALVIAAAVLSGLYVWLYDPLQLCPECVTGDAIAPNVVRLYMTGTKVHDNCSGESFLIVEEGRQFFAQSTPKPTGLLPVGHFVRIERDIVLNDPLEPGDYTARFVIVYHCLIDFRHQASFEITVPETFPPVRRDENSEDG